MGLQDICCRLMRCLGPRTHTADKRGTAGRGTQDPGDDLTVIKGIGIVTQDRLHKAGIRTYGDLAEADPETIIQAAGQQNARSRIADWIAQAKKLDLQSTQ
jgi:predicted flap endonuclease-1-like 5' DNA nuclease